ncbi:MAG: YopX family protein [Flavobacteriaceae bacterium]|jgi:uncharacterized phage protein (TIGR01671 family)|nr:YopX family protein [Flavobacteriaceae bacterium]
MKREIKFRAWNNYYKEMISHEDLITLMDEGETKETIPLHYVKEYTNLLAAILSKKELQERYDLMEFTGLYDKNGKEICEGDICKITQTKFNNGGYFQSDDMTTENEYIGKCLWNNASAQFQLVYEYIIKGQSKKMTFGFKDCEIIGNIHENKDLLKL